MKKIAVILVAMSLLFSAGAKADEGMYPLDSTDTWPVETMKKNGLEIKPETLLDIRRAIAKVAGGGSGSFISSRGLLVTNHHVAFRCLATLDGTEKHKGIMDKGFVAQTTKQEINCPGYDLMVVEDVRDITAQVLEAAGKKTGHRRFEAIRLKMEAMEETCQKDGFFCSADPLDGGRWYHMMVYRAIKDVRLVYAPERDLGKFGGDIDNWRYPRHTADFTFLRAYVNERGEGASYSPDNVPFVPKAHLTVSDKGVIKGDQVIVMGFPARTRRNFPSAFARFSANVDMPVRSKFYGGILNVIKKISASDERSQRRYQGLDASLNNAVKYYADSIEGFKKWQLVEKRAKRDKQADKKLVAQINKIFDRYAETYDKFFAMRSLSWLIKSLGTAVDIAMWTTLRDKPDKDRKEDRYKNKNLYKVFGASDRLDDQITLKAERALLAHVIKGALRLDKKQQIKAIKKLIKWGKKADKALKKEAQKASRPYADYFKEITGTTPVDDTVEKTVAILYGQTQLVAKDDNPDELDRALFQRRRLFYNPVQAAKNSKDPLLKFAKDLAAEFTKFKKRSLRPVEETFDSQLRPQFAKQIKAPYPDANFQPRMNHGTVKDYTATKNGKTYRYMTDLQGVINKDKGEYPFNVPPKLKELAASNDKGRFVDTVINDVPVNFTCTLDTTGGNSGSGVLDNKGRLVGLLFDGTPESVLSDWQFLPDDQRSIVMDIRYALFLAEKIHNATNLLKELGF